MTGAAALILFWQLMLPPVAGIADNGDFGKLLGRFGLGSGKTFVYADTRFFFADENRYRSGFCSSELLLIVPALAINRVISRDGFFDLRIMGAVHGWLFLLAVFLFAPLVDSAAIGLAALLLFTDFMYVGFFNSFYMDAASILFTLLAAVFYLRAMRWRRPADSLGLAVSMALAVLSKSQYAILGPWFAVLFWTGRGFLAGGRRIVAAAASLALLASAWVSYRYLAPEGYADKAVFTVIFSQILPAAKDPDRALSELGLDPSYRQWIGLQAYSPGVPLDQPAFYADFHRKTSLGKIARFYLRHPADAWTALGTALDEAGSFRSPLGNFDSRSGKPPAAKYESFQLVSGWKRRIFYRHGARLAVFAAVLTGLLPAMLWRHRRKLPDGAWWGGAALAAMALSTLIVSALADVYDQFRHEVVAFAMLDMVLLALAWRQKPKNTGRNACITNPENLRGARRFSGLRSAISRQRSAIEPPELPAR